MAPYDVTVAGAVLQIDLMVTDLILHSYFPGEVQLRGKRNAKKKNQYIPLPWTIVSQLQRASALATARSWYLVLRKLG